jgi:N-acetylmuramoyl-L-alanine amidase
MTHRRRPYAASAAVALVTLVVLVVGCAVAIPTGRRAGLPELASRQRAYAEAGATSAQWEALALAFDAVAAARSASPADAERASFGAAVGRVYADGDATLALDSFVSRYPSSEWADDALHLLADEHARAGRDGKRRSALRAIVNDHPRSPHAADAWATLWPSASAPDAPATSVHLPTPLTAAPTIVQELGLGIRTVMVDAGHGGRDPGATAAGRPHEKEIALDMAMRVGDELRAAGLTVLMTRDADIFVPLGARNAMAAAEGADLFVSLHVNHFDDPAAQGAETWIAAPARDERSALVAARENLGAGSTSELADYVSQLLSETKTEESRALAEAIQADLVGATGATDRGVKEAGFVVLLGLRVPSALVEMGFLTNADEATRLADAGFRAKMAEGIASGIVRYVRSRSYIP